MTDEELKQILRSLTVIDDRTDLYAYALKDMWKFRPNTETQKRLDGFIRSSVMKRRKWIDWVEERAQEGNPAWCVELIGMAIARKIEGH